MAIKKIKLQRKVSSSKERHTDSLPFHRALEKEVAIIQPGKKKPANISVNSEIWASIEGA